MRIFRLLLTALIILAILSLSQVVGRLLGFHEYINASAILTLVIFLTAVSVFFISRSTQGITAESRKKISPKIVIGYLIVVCILAFVVAYSSYYPAPYPFAIENAAITVNVYDVEGTSGHVDGQFRLEVLRDGLNQILWGNLGSTGLIRNVTVSDPDKKQAFQVSEQAGQWQIKLLFPEPLKKAQQVTFQLGFDIVESVPEPEIYWEHVVTCPTRNLEITLIVPMGRACKAVDARSEDAVEQGAELQVEVPPIISDDHTKLTWKKANPQIGRTYIVTCH